MISSSSLTSTPGSTMFWKRTSALPCDLVHSALAIVPVTGHTFELRVEPRWVSPAYGTRLRSSGIIYRLIAEVPFENMFLLIPFRPGEEEKVQQIQEATVRA